jgi:class 3 adenylate cyclase/CHASE2 domain-containing sensor protein
LLWVFCFIGIQVKSKSANLIPLYITGAALLFSVCLHIVSRYTATRHDDGRSRGVEITLVPEQVEALTYDARVKLGASFNQSNDLSSRMATLFFDDVSVDKVNRGDYSMTYAPAVDHESAEKLFPRQWPWPRFIHGQIVRELAAEGATAVGFDILFPELAPERPEESVKDPELGTLSSDEFFAVEMGRARNVFLGVQEEDTVPAQLFLTNAAALASIASHSDQGVLRRVKPFHEVRLWHPLIRSSIKKLNLDLRRAQQSNNTVSIPNRSTQESESVIYEIPLNSNGTMKLTRDGDIDFGDDPDDNGPETEKAFITTRVWNLGISLAAKALGLDLEHPEIRPERIILRGADGAVREIPLDPAGYFYIDWSIRYRDVKNNRLPIHHANLEHVLAQDKFRVAGNPEQVSQLTDEFKNRVVLVGSVASGNNMSDLGATPLEAQSPLVTKHLNIANSLLTGRFVERTSLVTEAVLIIVLGLAAWLLTWRMRVLSAAIATALLCVVYIAFTTWMYVGFRYWVPMIMPMFGGLVLPHFSLVTYRVIFEQKEQRRVRGIFSKIVAPDVVQELLSAEKLALGGARRKLTVFFADVRGFTEFTDSTQQAAEDYVSRSNLSEADATAYFDRIAAEQLATVNLYLATIADTVKAHHGTVDKYMGDCVMAFWGAPAENQQHALCCVRAAIDCQRALYRLNQERFSENESRKKQNAALASEGKAPLPLLPLLSLGTGINSGFVTVGLMGSDATILNYSVFGREVNLASRLEGASGRGRIIISEATYLDMKRDDPTLAATCVAQAPITPKGFRQPVKIYEVPWKPQQETPTAAPETASTPATSAASSAAVVPIAATTPGSPSAA